MIPKSFDVLNKDDAANLLKAAWTICDYCNDGVHCSDCAITKIRESIHYPKGNEDQKDEEFLPRDDASDLLIPWAKFDISNENLERYIDNVDIYQTFYNAFQDDCDCEINRIVEDYKNLDASGRSVVDAVFVRLCGWSLPSLLRKAAGEAYQ